MDFQPPKNTWKIVALVIVGILILAGAAWGGYYWWQNRISRPVVCTQDAAQCSDGSYVSRTGPNCEFAPCPEAKADETANWQTYRNKQYGFEVKLPPDWSRVKMLNVSSADWGNYVSFCLDDEGGQLWKIFDIGVYTKSDWEKVKKEKAAKITYLAENNSYVYASISPDDHIPFAASSYLNSVDQILFTFKFTK